MGRMYICPNSGCPFKRLFSCLEPAQAEALGRARLGRHYDPGEIVFNTDTLALAVFCIHAGSVRLARPMRGGRDVVVGVRGAGDVLGFREVLAEMPYQVGAEVLAPSMICEVPRETFVGVVRENPELAQRLMKRLAHEYLNAETQLVVRAHLDVTARIAHLLSARIAEEQADGGRRPPAVRMGREEMALLAGTTRESVSRCLARLARRGIVRLDDGTIHIRDLEQLQDLMA